MKLKFEIIGFTGTRDGMTQLQTYAVAALIHEHKSAMHFVHGACRGSDEQAAGIAKLAWIKTVARPGNQPHMRTTFKSDIEMSPTSMAKRNQAIVNDATVLIAAPKHQEDSSPRSGTWQTIRMARRKRIRIYIVWPDGTIQVDQFERIPT